MGFADIQRLIGYVNACLPSSITIDRHTQKRLLCITKNNMNIGYIFSLIRKLLKYSSYPNQA